MYTSVVTVREPCCKWYAPRSTKGWYSACATCAYADRMSANVIWKGEPALKKSTSEVSASLRTSSTTSHKYWPRLVP